MLVESTRDRESGRLVGYSRNYARVLLDGPDAWADSEVRVRTIARQGDPLVGVIGPSASAAPDAAAVVGNS